MYSNYIGRQDQHITTELNCHCIIMIHSVILCNVHVPYLGGRHYSDSSDRRYSDSPQSGQPSTSLTPLGICRNSLLEIGKKLEGVEASHASKARHWSRHRANLSPMHIGSSWHFKLSYQNFEMPDPIWVSNSPLIFRIWFGVFPVGTARRPV